MALDCQQFCWWFWEVCVDIASKLKCFQTYSTAFSTCQIMDWLDFLTNTSQNCHHQNINTKINVFFCHCLEHKSSLLKCVQQGRQPSLNQFRQPPACIKFWRQWTSDKFPQRRTSITAIEEHQTSTTATFQHLQPTIITSTWPQRSTPNSICWQHYHPYRRPQLVIMLRWQLAGKYSFWGFHSLVQLSSQSLTTTTRHNILMTMAHHKASRPLIHWPTHPNSSGENQELTISRQNFLTKPTILEQIFITTTSRMIDHHYMNFSRLTTTMITADDHNDHCRISLRRATFVTITYHNSSSSNSDHNTWSITILSADESWQRFYCCFFISFFIQFLIVSEPILEHRLLVTTTVKTEAKTAQSALLVEFVDRMLT